MIGIYKIQNKLNSKGKQLIDEIIQLEGIENFNFEILKEVEKEELNYWEDYYITKFNSIFPNGYNKKWNCNKEIRRKIKGKIEKEKEENRVEEKTRTRDFIIEGKEFFLEENELIALPEEDYIFKAMSDILYTYLYSISKHNPKKVCGQYIENYNYIYLDRGPEGEKKYSHKDTYTKLGLSKTTYYRRLNVLKDLDLVIETKRKGRKIFKIPFIESNRILHVKTCSYLSTAYKDLKFPPEDIIKTLCLLKIYYCSNDKTFTTRLIKANLGYSLTNTDKDDYVHLILGILRGLDLVDYRGEVAKDGEVEKVIYTLLKVDDSFNSQLEIITTDKTICEIGALTEKEIKKIYKFN